MAKRRSRGPFVALGVTLLALAGLVHFWVVPALNKLPADTDTTAKYAGSSQSIDSSTLRLGPATAVSAARRVTVARTDGDVAVLKSSVTMHTPAGDRTSDHTYAIDRADYRQTAAPAGVKVEDQHGGMVISQPQHPSKKTFTVYDTVTQTAQSVTFQKATTVAGREALRFAGTTTAAVKDPALLQQLQGAVAAMAKTGNGTTLPKPMLTAMVQAMAPSLGADKAKQFDALLASLPDQVPLTFLSTNRLDVAIDAGLGAPLRSNQTQTTVVAIAADTPVPLLTISQVDLKQTAASSKQVAGKLDAAATKLALISTWIPLALTVVGLLLIGAGVLGGRSRRAEGAGSASQPKPANV